MHLRVRPFLPSLALLASGVACGQPSGAASGSDASSADATARGDAALSLDARSHSSVFIDLDSAARPGTGRVDGGPDSRADIAPDASPDASPRMFIPPTDMRDRIGIYAWGYDTSAWPGTPDRLNWAVNEATALGARMVRVYLGPEDIYDVLASDAGTLNLTAVASSPAYATLISSASVDTYLLTTYSAADETGNWSGGYGRAAATVERSEIAKLGAYLLATYPSKTFTLLNWEGDNALASFAGSTTAWDGYAAWIAARAGGVSDAHAAAGPNAKLYSGLELNVLRNASTGDARDAAANPCVVSKVLPAAPVDYYSYSSWDSLLPGQAPSAVATQLASDLSTALVWAKMGDPSATAARFLVGEFGSAPPGIAPRPSSGRSRAGRLLGQLLADHRQRPVRPARRLRHRLRSLQGERRRQPLRGPLQDALPDTVPTAPVAPSYPAINQGGVVNATTSLATDVDAGTVLSIFYGADFTDTGDVVHVKEATEDWDVVAGSTWFYESAAQVNFQLPGVGPGQNALVYLTDGDGIDSNGQNHFDLAVSASIAESCGVVARVTISSEDRSMLLPLEAGRRGSMRERCGP